MFFLQGSPVYTPFRKRQLLARLHAVSPRIDALNAHYGYFIEAPENFSDQRCQQLSALLPHSTLAPLPRSSASLFCWVVPRLGTLSPWSSKATDIAHICGFESIVRIERGIFFEVGVPANALNEENKKAIMAQLHDPLTESVLTTHEALSLLFQHNKPRSFTEIDVIGGGFQALVAVNERLGLALSVGELEHVVAVFRRTNGAF